MKDILHMDRLGKCFHQKTPSTGFEGSRWDCLVEWIQGGLSKSMCSRYGMADPKEIRNELKPKLPLKYTVLK